MMDYFGRLVDDLTDLFESIETSAAAPDAGEVLKALQRVMVAAAKAERLRNTRLRQSQAVAETDQGAGQPDAETIFTRNAA